MLRESLWGRDAASYSVWGPQGPKCQCNNNKNVSWTNPANWTNQECPNRTLDDSLLDTADRAHPCEMGAGSTYRLEVFDCSSDVGEYVVMLETSGELDAYSLLACGRYVAFL